MGTDIFPTGWDVAARVTGNRGIAAKGKEGILGEEPPRNFLRNHAHYFGYKCDQYPFLHQSCIGKASKVTFLESKGKMFWLAGNKYCIERK